MLPKYHVQKVPRNLYCGTYNPVASFSLRKTYVWAINSYIKLHKISKKIDPDRNSVKNRLRDILFPKIKTSIVTQKVIHLCLIVILRWKWWRMILSSYYQMKTVELEEETNIIERTIEKCSGNSSSTIFNIIASKSHISMGWCVHKFHPFPTIVCEYNKNYSQKN